VALDPQQTLSFAMALHELYTNALKYGALLTDAGRITLAWSTTPPPDPRLKLEWRETEAPADTGAEAGFDTGADAAAGTGAGTGAEAGSDTAAETVAAPEREGFGTRLIRQLFTHDLGGEVTLDFTPTGLTCTADLPLR
jgi:two-component sensor histidine kinase